MFSMTNKFLLP